MKQYIGTKIIEAEPAYRCMDGHGHITITDDLPVAFPNFPSVEDGYRVRYADGYVSWSPKEAFEEAYRPTDAMNFGLAIEAAKRGAKIARRGWNGKGQYVELASAISYVTPGGETVNAEHEAIGNRAFAFVGSSGVQMGWLASQADMLADDWHIVK
ncbi:DUF2829 domain-containing protein [Flavonifractor sp. DFI.6.63]|jgi:hypothetical protein|uniref:DUF2829 domain-containing protein n=1 Tax=Flavonifractor TaxID=946234 RepID=UPI001D07820E|nr:MULTISPECIES: DUF2829 domain-containing protein [Flavonifractor]MCB7039565.1 DUF2829 domain-containing protein [Flavonifractor plautii]MCQ5028976.1 DUF2829 domain-containing protein [Flavonifractor sp. DFI.6.63]DAR77273.1 MAG TPA: Protein of unknown function (DUF2829) [Caudoviricetes sp.]